MAKLFNFKYSGGANEMKASFDLETGDDYVEQDITHIKEAIKAEKDKEAIYGLKNSGYRKMATIPDIVALEILTKHRLDLHSPDFMRDPNNLKKLKKILVTEYRDLVFNT